MSKIKEPIPVLITLVGDKGVGKSHYLYALGLALKERHSVFRDCWKITQLDENYAKQLDDWNTQYRAEQTISTPTDRFLYLSFEVCNGKRCYKVILLDWAGENLLPSTNFTDKLKLELRRSTSTLLMFDVTLLKPETQSDFQSKWESLLKQDDFREALTQSLGKVFFDMPLRVCFTHAEVFGNVERALKKNPRKLDDKSYLEYAEQVFESYPQFSEIRNLLKQGDTRFKSYYSAVLLEQRIHYNLICPILDTLDDMETVFNMKTPFSRDKYDKRYLSIYSEIERKKTELENERISLVEKSHEILRKETEIENQRVFLIQKSRELSSKQKELDTLQANIQEEKKSVENQKAVVLKIKGEQDSLRNRLRECKRELFEEKEYLEKQEKQYEDLAKLQAYCLAKLKSCRWMNLIFFGAIGLILYALA